MRNQSFQEGAHAEETMWKCAELCKCGGEGENCTSITPPVIEND